MATKKPGSVEEYISGFPTATKKILEQVRATIIKAAPKAEEGIGYAMPAYKLNGLLVYFAGYEKHIGFTQRQVGMKLLKKSYRNINREKVPCSFRSTSQCHWL